MKRNFKVGQVVTVRRSGKDQKGTVLSATDAILNVRVGSETITTGPDGFDHSSGRKVRVVLHYRGKTPKQVKQQINASLLNTETFQGVQVEDLPTRLTGMPHFWRARFNSSTGGRLYFNKTANHFYSGITTPIGAVSSGKMILQKAALEAAYKGRIADLEWAVARDYGSLLHLLISLVEEGLMVFKFEGGEWENLLEQFVVNGYYYDWRQIWRQQIRNDMAAYLRFKKDHNVVVLSSETVVSSDKWRIATPLDLIVEMDWKGQRIKANINLKSGDKPFTEENIAQVGMEMWLWNQEPRRPFDLDKTFLWRPKGRERSPGNYEVKEGNPAQVEFFEYVGQTCLLQEMYVAKGKVVIFEGDSEEFKITTIEPLDWLKLWQA